MPGRRELSAQSSGSCSTWLAGGTRGVSATDVKEVTPFVKLTPAVDLALLLLHTAVSQKQGEMKKYLCWLPNQIEDKLLLSSSSV